MARGRTLSSILLATALLFGPAPAEAAAPPFYAFESAPVRPVAIAPGGRLLLAVNTPDDRLEVFRITDAGLAHVDSVPVGMEPVAVAARSEREVWVVNHLSDSVSIVALGEGGRGGRVVRTLLVGDEPNDIVFAGQGHGRAFVTTAHRGQNSPYPRGQYREPGVGRADVWVFDAAAPGDGLGGEPVGIVTLFGDKPRALAASPDGKTVYAAVFHSGNRTTALHEDVVCEGGADAPPCVIDGVKVPGGLPAPNENHEGEPGPEVGLIVQFDPAAGESGAWVDELGRDWSAAVPFALPDLDVFAIDAMAAKPAEKGSFAGVGAVLFNMAVNPVNGAVYVSNTAANNRVRFEGPGKYAMGKKPPGEPTTVRGHIAEARITVIKDGSVAPRHLNKHIDYAKVPVPPGVKERSLATPLQMVVSPDGKKLYVAAFGSSKVGVFDTAALEADSFEPDAGSHITVPGGGPAGLALDGDRGRLYVLTRFDNSVQVVDLASGRIVDAAKLHNPEPPSVVLGRPLLYDARHTSSNGEASCSSCHVFGDVDDLAWDLGNPDDDVAPNPNPVAVRGHSPPFHPMKGPMATQTFRGMHGTGPLHWRGDRTGGNFDPPVDPLDSRAGFIAFNVAFGGLVGRDRGPLSDAEMNAFADFALSIVPPPNPIRQLDNGLREDEARGFVLYNKFPGPDFVKCDTCHRRAPALGQFGTAGGSNAVDVSQEFKTPQLRNMYQKVGRFGMAPAPYFINGDNGHKGPQIRGFGFLHDGSIDTVFRFMRARQFARFDKNLGGDPTRRDVEAFVMAFDSNLAPIVGQQVTLHAANAEAAGPRIDLMIARAGTPFAMQGAPEATECDLVAHYADGEARMGYLLGADGRFAPADGGEPIDDAALRARAGDDATVTYTCAPPGTGRRKALDRDLDGVLDVVDACPTRAGDACDGFAPAPALAATHP